MYETSATIVIPTNSNAEMTIIAISFFSSVHLSFSRGSKRPKQSQLSLRITVFAHTLGGEMCANKVDEAVDLDQHPHFLVFQALQFV